MENRYFFLSWRWRLFGSICGKLSVFIYMLASLDPYASDWFLRFRLNGTKVPIGVFRFKMNQGLGHYTHSTQCLRLQNNYIATRALDDFPRRRVGVRYVNFACSDSIPLDSCSLRSLLLFEPHSHVSLSRAIQPKFAHTLTVAHSTPGRHTYAQSSQVATRSSFSVVPVFHLSDSRDNHFTLSISLDRTLKRIS